MRGFTAFRDQLLCSHSRTPALATLLGLGIGVSSLFGLSGCGGSKAPAPEVTEETSPQPATNATPPASPAPASPMGVAATENAPSSTNKDGRKWLGNIPYDVWFDEPLNVVANSQTVATPNAVANNTPAGNPGMAATTPAGNPAAETPMEVAATPAAGGGLDWGKTISAEDLQEEVKRIRNRLTQQLQSTGTYSGNYKDIQADGAVIAAVAAVVERHNEDLSWKANAKFVRELGKQLREASKALGKEGFDKTTTVFEKIVSVLSGSVPPDVGNAEDQATFGEAVSRAGVMVRMQKAFDWMKSNVNTEGKLKSEQETVLHETKILVLLSVIVADSTYDSAGEDDYKKHAQSMIQASQAAAAAAKDLDFAKFQEALDKVNNACSNCHNDYRFADT